MPFEPEGGTHGLRGIQDHLERKEQGEPKKNKARNRDGRHILKDDHKLPSMVPMPTAGHHNASRLTFNSVLIGDSFKGRVMEDKAINQPGKKGKLTFRGKTKGGDTGLSTKIREKELHVSMILLEKKKISALASEGGAVEQEIMAPIPGLNDEPGEFLIGVGRTQGISQNLMQNGEKETDGRLI